MAGVVETGNAVNASVRETVKKPQEIPPGAPWNPIEDAFLRRRSVRKYSKKQVPEHYIRRILEVARYAPSHGNCQPWRFVVVQDPKMMTEINEYAANFMAMVAAAPKDASAAMPEMHPVPRKLITEGPPGENLGLFHGAPTVIFPLMDSRGIGHPEIDLGIVGTNIVMAAYSLGLGTCWVGFVEMLLNTGGWPERLGVEEPYKLIDGIAVGFPVGDPHKRHAQRETHRTTWFDTDGQERTIY